jgi:catechol 2,3-dioxygenase-like lactoylglutathione lyase family enzyme
MKVKEMNHIALNTRYFVESLKFYTDILGFKELHTVDMGDFSIAYIEIPGGGKMELFDYRGMNNKNKQEDSDVGLRHFAFTVENVAEHEAQLREKGVSITLPTTDIPELGARVLLFLDPNGITLEFCEDL